MRAIETQRVRTLTSPSHIYAQSKLAFARAWEGKRPASIPETHALLDLDRRALVEDREGWVVKRAMGRVGDEVFVGPLFGELEWGPLVDHARALASQGEAWIAQRFVPQRPVPTPWGERLVTLGVYVAEGRFAGYFARLSPYSHVSHDALCVPVFAATRSA